MPLITTLAGASARGYGGLLASAIPQSYESIATVTVGAGGTSTVTFSSIPQTYSHLQIRYIGKNTKTTAGWQDLLLRFNSDSGGNYVGHSTGGNGASTFSGWSGIQTTMQIGNALPTSATGEANMFGGGYIDILDYTNTSKNTTTRSLTGFDKNGSGWSYNQSGFWNSTAAVTRIDLTTDTSLIAQNSRFALYGIKGVA